jgi:hypothetical protein
MEKDNWSDQASKYTTKKNTQVAPAQDDSDEHGP